MLYILLIMFVLVVGAVVNALFDEWEVNSMNNKGYYVPEKEA